MNPLAYWPLACQWPGEAGLQVHHLSLCATVDILRYAGCGSASPVDEARPKTYCIYDSVKYPKLKFLHKEVRNHKGRKRKSDH
jgi:hypothetical protein